jgi:hypothetical protein
VFWLGGGGGAWVWRCRLLAWEEEETRECTILLLNVVLQAHVHDRWKWLPDPTQGSSVRGAYHFLTFADGPLGRERIDNVWHNHIPLKVSLFVLCLLRNHLPTRDNLVRQRVINNELVSCLAGCGVLEEADHLFLGCIMLISVWSLVWQWLQISSINSCVLCDHFYHFCHMAGMPRSSHSFFKVIWFACVWNIWKERNNRVFNNNTSDPNTISDNVKLTSFLWLKAH